MRYDRETYLGIGDYKVIEYGSACQELRSQAVELLAGEFYPQDVKEGIKKFSGDIDLGKERVLCVTHSEEVVGASTYKVYAFDEISSQLFYQGRFDGNDWMTDLRFVPFDKLLLQNRFLLNYQYVSELAYSVVKQEHRGKGLGNFMFKARLDRLKLLDNPYLIFTIARGIYAQLGITNKLKDIVLDVEKSKNGVKEREKVNVRGEWVDTPLLSSQLGCEISRVNYDAGAQQTVHLSRKFNFKPLGFSKNLSPLWCLEGKL